MEFNIFTPMELNNQLKNQLDRLKGPIFILGAESHLGAHVLHAISSVRSDCFALVDADANPWRLHAMGIRAQSFQSIEWTPESIQKVFKTFQPKVVFDFTAFYGDLRVPDYKNQIALLIQVLSCCAPGTAYLHAAAAVAAPADVIFKPAANQQAHAFALKMFAEVLRHAATSDGIQASGFVFPEIFGEWQYPSHDLPQLLNCLRQQRPVPDALFSASRCFIDIQTVFQELLQAALSNSANGQTIDLSKGRSWSFADLAEWLSNTRAFADASLATEDRATLIGLRRVLDWQSTIDYSNLTLGGVEERASKSKISAIIACYKDAQAIPVMYDRLVHVFSELETDYEIIFVNDCSPDNTEDVLAPICASDPKVIAITHSRNFGSQAAFQSGMEISTGDAVVLMDGDLQDPPEMIPRFYKRWKEGFEVVYGRRIKRQMNPFMGALYKLFYRIFRKLSYVEMPVDAGDFSMIDRKVVRELINLPETEQFIRGLRAWVGFRQTGEDYVRPERMFGVSTNNWIRNIGWAKKAIFSFSFVPLEAMSYLGFMLTATSFLAIIGQIISRFLFPSVPQGVTTIIVLILFFGGVQLLAISLIGEYISKIFDETKKRPKFIRRKVIKGGKLFDTPESIDSLIDHAK